MSGMPAARAAGPLIFALGGAQTHFDPHAGQDYPTMVIVRNMYDGLVDAVGNPPQVVPRLATEWTVSPDGTVYTFKLNPDAKFHDGTPVTADDVKYSFKRIRSIGRGNGWMIDGVVGDDSVRVIDEKTVEITLLKPFAPFMKVLPWISIVNAKLIAAKNDGKDGQDFLLGATAGSGPFDLGRFEPENFVEFKRSKDYFRPGAGNADTVIWRYVRETINQRLMLERGELQMAMDLTSDDMKSLAGVPGINRVIAPGDTTFGFKLNTAHGPMADPNLRAAVSYAFDYEAMLKVSGLADLLQGPLPNYLFGHDPDLVVPRRDLAKAREYLAKTQYKDGNLKLTVTYVAGLEQMRLWCLTLLDSLRELNIAVDILAKTWPECQRMAERPETFPDLFCVGQIISYADPDVLMFASFHSSRNGTWQNPVYKNPEVDALIEAGRFEPDQEKRKQIYKSLQEKIVGDYPEIQLVLDGAKVGLRDNVQNYLFTPVIVHAPDFFPLSLS